MLPGLFLKSQELLTVRIIPNSKLKLFLIPVKKVQIQVKTPQKVGVDFLNAFHLNCSHFNFIKLGIVEISEVYVRSEPLSFVEKGGPCERMSVHFKICGCQNREHLLSHSFAFGVEKLQPFTSNLHALGLNFSLGIFAPSTSFLFCGRRNSDLTQLAPNFALLIIKTIFENDKWMVNFYVKTGAEGALLKVRKDICVEDCPIGVHHCRI